MSSSLIITGINGTYTVCYSLMEFLCSPPLFTDQICGHLILLSKGYRLAYTPKSESHHLQLQSLSRTLFRHMVYATVTEAGVRKLSRFY